MASPPISVGDPVQDAERLYGAVMRTLQSSHMMGLLAAVGDAKSKVPWDQVSPKTRNIFYQLIANLTTPPA
jgi:O-acetylhomoserine/O-acetylserine sulfhydrylase-like pyridoxal-dependent enzyme